MAPRGNTCRIGAAVPVRSLGGAGLALALLATLLVAPADVRGKGLALVANDNSVSALNINADGSLSEVSGSPFGSGTVRRGVAIAPDGKHAYVTNVATHTVSAFAINQDGSLTQVGAPVGAGFLPFGVAVTPDGKRVYIANSSISPIMGYDVNGDGSLTQLGGFAPSDGSTTPDVAVSPAGNRLYSVNTTGDNVTAFSIGPDGSLSQIGPSVPAGSIAPIAIATTPDGSHVYVTNQTTPGSVAGYNVNADGSLAPVAGSPFPAADLTHALAVTPGGGHVYATNRGTNDVSAFNVGADGALAPIGTYATGGSDPQGIAVLPDGTRVYATHQSTRNIAGLSIGGDGSLTPIAGSPFAQADPGNDRRGIAIAPNQGPSAAFATSPGLAGAPTTFNASGSSDPDGSVARYDWDFGDGTTLANGGATPAHTYAAAGTYTVGLTVTDDEGCSTAVVFTGHTASCNGSAAARATASVTVSTLTLTLTGRKRQRLNRKGVKVTAECPQADCELTLKGSIKLSRAVARAAQAGSRGGVALKRRSQKVKLRSRKLTLSKGTKKAIRVKFRRKRGFRTLRRALRRGRRARVRLRGTATAQGQTAQAKRNVKLTAPKRKRRS